MSVDSLCWTRRWIWCTLSASPCQFCQHRRWWFRWCSYSKVLSLYSRFLFQFADLWTSTTRSRLDLRSLSAQSGSCLEASLGSWARIYRLAAGMPKSLHRLGIGKWYWCSQSLLAPVSIPSWTLWSSQSARALWASGIPILKAISTNQSAFWSSLYSLSRRSESWSSLHCSADQLSRQAQLFCHACRWPSRAREINHRLSSWMPIPSLSLSGWRL